MRDAIDLGGRLVGEGEPVCVIAEGCDNHLGSLEVAKEMVRLAKLAGADVIKFQHHIVHEEMLREGFPRSDNFDEPLDVFLDKHALKLEDHEELFSYCREVGIVYLCTPFSLAAARELHEMGVPAFKIGSGELTDLPSLRAIAGFGKPMIVSTGMASWEEIDGTVEAIREINQDLILMNCTSEYPARHEDVNLGVIPMMRERYGLVVGHSDHTPDIHTAVASVAVGAKLVEKHFILDRRQPGPDQSVSIDPHELHELVSGVRRVEQALGAEKKVHERERQIREWAHRSVVSLTSIPRGTRIDRDMVWTKRPGTGIPAARLDEVVGRVAGVDIPPDHLIRWEELTTAGGDLD